MSGSAARNESGSPRLGVVAVALGVGLIGYEAAAHWAAVEGQGPTLGALIALGPALAALLLVALRTRRFAWLAPAGAILVALAVLIARRGVSSLTLLYPVPSVSIYVLLLWWFGRTLAPGREALVTGLARHVHGTLPPEIEAYTRHVNWAWCVFFAAMALTSVALFALAPLATWSLFANVLTVPLIALMFVGEYVYRVSRYRDFAHVSLLTAVRAFRDRGRAAVSTGRGG
jgi:uncharacterized membrane protein